MGTTIFDPPTWPRALLRLRTLCAIDEVASTIRHQALNELTGMGALVYRLRSRVIGTGGGAGSSELGPLFDAIEARLQGAPGRMRFRFLAPTESGARTDLGAQARALLDALGVRAELLAGPAATAVIAADELEVALGCVVENAVEALALGGTQGLLELRIERREDRWALEVRDEGVGVEPEVFERVYEPFFTTHPGRAGLGLKIARRIVNRWAGEITLSRRDPRGLSVVLVLPAA